MSLPLSTQFQSHSRLYYNTLSIIIDTNGLEQYLKDHFKTDSISKETKGIYMKILLALFMAANIYAHSTNDDNLSDPITLESWSDWEDTDFFNAKNILSTPLKNEKEIKIDVIYKMKNGKEFLMQDFNFKLQGKDFKYDYISEGEKKQVSVCKNSSKVVKSQVFLSNDYFRIVNHKYQPYEMFAKVKY